MKQLRKKFALTDLQAKAILDMRLQKLTGLERDKIDQEYGDIVDRILNTGIFCQIEYIDKHDIIKEELREY